VALSRYDDGFFALRADGSTFSYRGGGGAPAGSNVMAIASSRYAGVFLKRDGTLQDWGSKDLPVSNNVVAIAATDQSGTKLAVRGDGAIFIWAAPTAA